MQEGRDTGKEGCKKVGIKERRYSGQEGFRTGGIQEGRDIGKEAQDWRDAEQERCLGGMQKFGSEMA